MTFHKRQKFGQVKERRNYSEFFIWGLTDKNHTGGSNDFWPEFRLLFDMKEISKFRLLQHYSALLAVYCKMTMVEFE